MNDKPEILYTTPTLYKGATSWYIEFYFWSDTTKKMERVRRTHDLNRKKNSPDLKTKKANFNQLLEFYKEELDAGYNPFDEEANAKVKQNRVSLTLKEARDAFKVSVEKLRTETSRVYVNTLDSVMKVMGEGTLIRDITELDIKKSLQKLETNSPDGKWRNSSFNNKRVQLGVFFEFLVSHKHLSENPVKGIKLKPKQSTENHDVFTDEDLKAVIKYLEVKDVNCANFCKLVYYTCIRPTELRLLLVKHVDIENKVIIIPDSIAKNKTEGYVNIDDEALEIVKAQIKGLEPNDFLFVHLYRKKNGRVPLSNNTMYGKLMSALKALKLDNKKYTLYSFKHTSNVKKYKAGWTIAEICAANRHKSLVETETYLKALLKFAPVTKTVPSII